MAMMKRKPSSEHAGRLDHTPKRDVMRQDTPPHNEPMKIGDIQKPDATKQIVLSSFAMIFLCFILPYCSLPMRSAGGAALFTVYFWLFPNSLRSLSGSLTPAYCLAAFVWVSAIVVGVMCFLGAVES
jgi:hypothetical protein